VTEPREYDLVFAIIILAIVIGILGAPFAWNEYDKLIDRAKITRNFNQIFIENDSTIVQETITEVKYSTYAIRAPDPTPFPTIQPKITDGFWCRDKTINIGKTPTDVKECYQFFSDGTYKWGYSPGRPMGKSLSCSGDPTAKCEYSFNSKDQYEVEGGYSYRLADDKLVDPLDPPFFRWSSTGIP
jgi:hypothetical protein